LTAACAARGVEPEDIEEPDVKAALLGSVARLAVPETARREVPAIGGAFLASPEATGRLGGGRALGAFAQALTGSYQEAASGKTKAARSGWKQVRTQRSVPLRQRQEVKNCCLGKYLVK